VGRRYEPQDGLGRALREIRERRGLTQEQVADAAGADWSWLSRLENGQGNPSWATLRRLAQALDVPLAELAELAERLEVSEGERPQTPS
jgi:transcriptional regulator with XRE-family HTH domain